MKNDPARFLRATSVRIGCWDPRDVVCATVLTTVGQLSLVKSLDAAIALTRFDTPSCEFADEPLSVCVWACYESKSIADVCRGIADVSSRDPLAQRLCYLDPELANRASIFVESGAQMVVAGLPFLSSSLLSMSARMRVFRDGNHPLTTGLLKQLPWQAIAGESVDFN